MMPDISASEQLVRDALAAEDDATLRRLAAEQGLCTDELRSVIWPRLPTNLSARRGVDGLTQTERQREFELKYPTEAFTADSMRLAQQIKDWNVIVADVNRSVQWFPDEESREESLHELRRLIATVLLQNPDLCYFQGYNVIAAVFLRILPNDHAEAVRVLSAITRSHFTHIMDDPTGTKMWDFVCYVYPIIGRADPALRQFLDTAELEASICVSWILTWLAYHIDKIPWSHLTRLFDFFLVSAHVMPIYFSAALILHRSPEILATECDMPQLFKLLNTIPPDLPVQDIIVMTRRLHEQVPLDSIEAEVDELIAQRHSSHDEFRARRAQMERRRRWGVLAQVSPRAMTFGAFLGLSIAMGVAYSSPRWYQQPLSQTLRVLGRSSMMQSFNMIWDFLEFH